VENFTFVVFNNSDGVSMINVTNTQIVDVQKLSITFRLSPQNLKDQRTYKAIQGSIDPCKVSKGAFGGVIAKMVQFAIAKHSNYKFQCAQPKGFYYAYNFCLNDSIVPRKFFGDELKFEYESSVKGKLASKKHLVDFFSFKLYGSIV